MSWTKNLSDRGIQGLGVRPIVPYALGLRLGDVCGCTTTGRSTWLAEARRSSVSPSGPHGLAGSVRSGHISRVQG